MPHCDRDKRILNRLGLYGFDRWYLNFSGSSYAELDNNWTPSGSFKIVIPFSDLAITDNDAFISGASQSQDTIVVDTSGGTIRAFAYVSGSFQGTANIPYASLGPVGEIVLEFDSVSGIATLSAGGTSDTVSWALDGNQNIRFIAVRAGVSNYYAGKLFSVLLEDLASPTNSIEIPLGDGPGASTFTDNKGNTVGTYVGVSDTNWTRQLIG